MGARARKQRYNKYIHVAAPQPAQSNKSVSWQNMLWAIGEPDSAKLLPTYPICAPEIARGVLPENVTKAPVQLAHDDGLSLFPGYLNGLGSLGTTGFPGFSYLAQLAGVAEYRAFASAISTELTRKWIRIDSNKTDGSSNEKN